MRLPGAVTDGSAVADLHTLRLRDPPYRRWKDLQRVGLPLPQAGPDPAIPLSWPALSSTSPWSPAANNGRAAAPWCLAP